MSQVFKLETFKMALIFILKRNLMWFIDISMVFHMTSMHQTTTMAGKIAHKVELCPRTTKDWLRASERLNCTNDFSNPVNRYHCLPADDLSTLVEFCYKETRPRVSKGSCMLYVQNVSYLNGYNCSGFSEGCPNNMYFSDESYQFPRCVEINSKRRCFVAESSCRESTKTNQTSHSTSTETSKRNDDVLAWSIFSAVFLLVVIVIVVICICISKRRVCHERITKKKDTSMTQIPGAPSNTDSLLPSDTEWRLRESPEKCSDISISNVDDVTHISCVDSEFIWLDNKQWAMKIDYKGEILSKIGLGDIWGSASSTVDENGHLLFIKQHNKVMKVKANEEEPIEMLTVDYHLSILSVYYAKLRSEILLRIYLQDGTKIVRYNKNVEKISEFEYHKHDKSMVYPLFLSENTNRDICIADNFDGRVRAFSDDDSGNLRQRYSYAGRSPHYDFSPTGICNDLRGHVLVCNCHKSNPSVYLLDINGRFLSMIIDGKTDVTDPWGLCAYEGKLYLSQKDCNVIKVFSYMYLEKINH